MSIKDYTIKVDNKLKGAFGETDVVKKVIRINKKRHFKKESGKEELLDTLAHEKMHAEHPKMHEKTVRKETPKVVARMSKSAKQKLYNLI